VVLTTSGLSTDTGVLTATAGAPDNAVPSTANILAAPGTINDLKCSALTVPAAPLLNLGVGCAGAQVSQDGKINSTGALAAAEGDVATVSVLPIGTSSLPLPTSQLTSLLAPILAPLQSAASNLPAPLSTIISTLAGALTGNGGTLASLAQINAGYTVSAVSATPTTATAQTWNSGVNIDLFNGLGTAPGQLLPILGDQPLIQVRIGAGDSAVTVCRVATTVNGQACTAGQSIPSSNPGLVEIVINAPGNQMTIPIAPGQCAPASLNILLTLCLGGGSVSAGTGLSGSTANSQGLTLHLLPSQNVANIDVATSNTQAGGQAGPSLTSAPVVTSTPLAAPAATPAAAATVPGVTTPHTGEPWAGPAPLTAVGLGMLGGLGLIARRRIGGLASRLIHVGSYFSPSAGGLPPGPASGTSSVPPPVSGPARRLP
jgi:hypothetical protein